MKKSVSAIMTLVLLLAACACRSFSNRGEISAPMIGSANQFALGVDRISLTDTSTVVGFVVHFNPGMWVRLAPSSAIIADGTAYEAVAFDGIEPAEQLTMPDSGVIRFAVTFPAIPADVRSIDFSEQTDDGWQLWGIDLTGNRDHNYNSALVPDDVIKASSRTEIPEPVIAAGDSATVSIRLLGYRPGMGDRLFWAVSSISGEYGTETPLDIDADGNATGRFDLAVPSEFIAYGIGSGGDVRVRVDGACMLSPGENADLYVDTHMSGLMNMAQASGDMSYEYPEDYTRSYFKGRYPGYRELHTPGLKLYSGHFGDYHMNGDQYTDYILAEYARAKAQIDSVSSTDSQRDFRTAMLNIDLVQAAVDAYSTLARNYYSSKGLWRTPVPPDTITVSLSPENVRAVAALIDFDDPNLMLSRSVRTASFDTKLWKEAGIDPGVLENVRLYNFARRAAEDGLLAGVAQLRERSEPLADVAEAYYMTSKAKLEAGDTALVTPTPDVPAEKIFDAIVAPHKGKVVMVDLWNTWCVPCRQSIAANEPDKDGDLSSDDIVWIYIADESSPRTTYLDMISNIRGIHYCLTDEQMKILLSRFDVDGIPYYILVDRKGNAAGRPDLRDHFLYKKTILDQL